MKLQELIEQLKAQEVKHGGNLEIVIKTYDGDDDSVYADISTVGREVDTLVIFIE